jgi:hypothetical protein
VVLLILRDNARNGPAANFLPSQNDPYRASLYAFNLPQSEEVREPIVLIIDGPTAGEAEAFSEPEHRFDAGFANSRTVFSATKDRLSPAPSLSFWTSN